jgi:glutathione S-transferase
VDRHHKGEQLKPEYLAINPNGKIPAIMKMTWPRAAKTFLGMDLSAYPHLERWLGELEARPAFQRALALKP